MKNKLINLIDFDKLNTLLEGFNKSTGFVTAIVDLEGNVLSKSGWRQICTDFHRVHPETAKKCRISDTELAGKMAKGEKYHFYKCLNGLVDVAVPIVINSEHLANLFSGQFFFEEPDKEFFRKQAEEYGFKNEAYIKALEKIPVVSEKQVKDAMEFLLNMTQLVSEMTFQKMNQSELNDELFESEKRFRTLVMASSESAYRMSPDWSEMYELDGRGFIADTKKTNSNWFQEYIPPDDQEKVMATIKEAIRTKSIFSLEHRVWRADGSRGWTSSRAIPRLNKKGEIFEWFGAASDITEHKLADEALKKSEAQLKAIIDNLNEAVIASTIDGDVFLWNEPGLKMFGFSTLTEVQHSLQKFTELFEVHTMDGKLVPLEEWPLSRILNGEVIRNWDVRLRHLNTGIETIFSYSGSLVYNDLGQPLMALVTVNDITERKRIEEELRKSELEFRTLAESMPQIVWATRPDGWNIYFNQQWVDYTGMILEESYGHGWNKPFHPDDQQRAWDAWQSATQNNAEYSIEARLRRYDGEYHWWLVRGVPQLNEQGEIVKWFGTCTDIDEFKQAEKKLVDSETKYRELFESMTAGFVLFEVVLNDKGIPVDLIIVTANEKFEATTGLKIQEVIGKQLSQVLPGIENDAADWINTYAEVALTGEPKKFEQGSDLLGFYYAVTAYQSGPKKCAVIFEDITERKKIENALKESEESYRMLFESINDAILVTKLNDDNTFSYINVNDVACKLYGYTREEFLSKTPDDIISENEKQTLEKRVQKVMNNDFNVIITEHVKKDGQNFPVEISTRKTKIRNTTIITAIIRDITESKKAEEKLKNSENKFSILFGQASLPAALTQFPDHEFVDVNNAWLKLFGFTKEEIIGKTSFEIGINPNMQRRVETIEKIAKQNEVRNIEQNLFSKTGEEITVLTNVNVVDINGKDFAITSIQDVTEKKKAEKALLESEEKYRNLFNTVQVGIFRTKIDGSAIVDLNDHFLNIFGYSKEEVYGLSTVMHWADPNQRDELINLLKNKGYIENYECQLLNKKGKVINCITSLRVNSEQGILEGSLVDITERKNIEEKINKLNDELDQKVKDRTSELEIKIKELNRLNKLFIDRELRMIELKQKIKDLDKGKSG